MKDERTKNNQSSRRDFLSQAGMVTAAVAVSSAFRPSVAHSSVNTTDKKELSGKTAFITGAARGIGLATAEVMAQNGANIVIYDIATAEIPHVKYAMSSEEDLKRAKLGIEKLGGKCLAVKGDVRNRSELDQAMQKAVTMFGSLDIVVCNAGVTQAGDIEQFTSEEISTVYDINVAGVIKTTQAAAPIMKKQKSGRIIFISSGLGRVGNPLFPIYTSTKWAVIGFAKSAALSYARYNITCNTVSPGLVNTKLVDNKYILNAMSPDNPTLEAVEKVMQNINPFPMGMYQPEEIARAVMLFASNVTAKVTGEVFDISSGATANNIG